MTDAASREIPMSHPQVLGDRRPEGRSRGPHRRSGGGCLPRNDFTGGIPQDYRQRHAIGLMQANHTLEVFVGTNGGTSRHPPTRIVAVSPATYAERAGPLVAYLPAGGHAGAVRQGLDNIRRALAGGGAAARLQIAHYPADGGAAPIKLVFAKLKADTTTSAAIRTRIYSRSGGGRRVQRPELLFRLRLLKNLAAQIADPRDLLRPRQEGPIVGDRRSLASNACARRRQSPSRLKELPSQAASGMSMTMDTTESTGAFDHIAPLPRVAIQAFCDDPDVKQLIQSFKLDRRMAKTTLRVQEGGIAACLEAYRGRPHAERHRDRGQR